MRYLLPVVLTLVAFAGVACEGEDPGGNQAVPIAERKPARSSPLLEPDCKEMNLTAPDLFKATFKTSQGTVVIEVHRDWAPLAADRFYSLVKNRFFDNCRIFRVVPDFIAQWGIHGQPKIAEMWTGANIPDEPRNETNARGTVAFAKANTPHSRATQVFINLKDNNDKANPSSLDNQDFAPFGKVIEGMSVVDKWYQGYGDHSNLDQGRLAREGNAYLSSAFPMLDYIVRATILEE